jgi:hypothetical protein
VRQSSDASNHPWIKSRAGSGTTASPAADGAGASADATKRWICYKQCRLSAEKAGELLGLSGRRFRRQCARYEAEGIDGLRDRRLGRVSNRRAPESELARMRRLYREEYADFTVQHFRAELCRRHGYRLGYTVTRLAPQSASLVTPAKRRGKGPVRNLVWRVGCS